MLKGARIQLRPIREEDWPTIEAWGKSRDALWGPYQRYQLDHLPLLHEAFQRTGLLSRESGILLAETIEGGRVVGFVRYGMLNHPDADHPHPEIGFGIPEVAARGQGYATEAVGLIVNYLLAGNPAVRVAAFTECVNRPAQRVLERSGFEREGVLRCAIFRDGQWRDLAVYARLRQAPTVAMQG